MLRKQSIAAACLACLLLGPTTGTAEAEDYLMTPGDVLDISLLGMEEQMPAGRTYLVRPDGTVSFPLAGVIDTKGMTVDEFTAVLTERLSRYYVDPDVCVNITKLGTTRVHVLGEIGKPGTYELTKSHTLLDAIGAAGGFTRDTAKKKVFLIHKEHQGEPIKLNLNDILKKGDVSQNYELVEDDVVYLTRNGRIDFARDILPWISGTYMIKEIKDRD